MISVCDRFVTLSSLYHVTLASASLTSHSNSHASFSRVSMSLSGLTKSYSGSTRPQIKFVMYYINFSENPGGGGAGGPPGPVKISHMATEGGHIDFMFLGPHLPGRWIRYCNSLDLHCQCFKFQECIPVGCIPPAR